MHPLEPSFGLLAVIAALAIGVPLAACNTPLGPMTPAQIASVACVGATAGVALIQADGTVVQQTAAQAASEAEASKLVTVNCAAIQAAIPALTTAASAGATALVAEEHRQASKMGISDALLAKIAARYR